MKYKRLIIGDFHGHFPSLYDIYIKEDPWEVIMLGDYFDNYTNNVEIIKDDFDKLVKLRQEHLAKGKGKFVMLLGNHDFHYLLYGVEQYSGYNKGYDLWAHEYLKVLWDNGDIQLIDYDYDNKTVYSHAGITNTWLSYNRMGGIDIRLLAENERLNLHSLRFTYAGGGDWYGDTKYSSPIWIRPNGLLSDMYKDEEEIIWTQIVGHTNSKNPECYYMKNPRIGWPRSIDYNIINNKKETPVLWIMDCMPYYYISEEIDENRNVLSRKIIKNDLIK